MGLVSGYGVFLGYVGAIAGLLLVAPFARGPLLPAAFGEGRAAAFLPTAVFFAVFAVPLFLAVRDGPRRGPRASLREAIHEVREGLLDTRRYPGVRTLLVANFLLVDAVNTGILYMAVYAQVVMGMDDRAKLPLFIVSTTTAALGSLAAGRACDRWGARRTLNVVFAVWAVALLALAVNTRVWLFWVLGSAVGAALGATWTAVRPLLAQLTPPESHGRFFGLYALSDKSAAVLGPLVWGLIVWAFRSDPVLRYRLAVAALALFVIAGFIIYRRVPEPKPARPAAEEAPS
jgi:UMF1 family MFS transporter